MMNSSIRVLPTIVDYRRDDIGFTPIILDGEEVVFLVDEIVEKLSVEPWSVIKKAEGMDILGTLLNQDHQKIKGEELDELRESAKDQRISLPIKDDAQEVIVVKENFPSALYIRVPSTDCMSEKIYARMNVLAGAVRSIYSRSWDMRKG